MLKDVGFEDGEGWWMDWVVQTMVLEEGQLHVGVPKGGGVDQRFLVEVVVSSWQVVDEVELGGLSYEAFEDVLVAFVSRVVLDGQTVK